MSWQQELEHWRYDGEVCAFYRPDKHTLEFAYFKIHKIRKGLWTCRRVTEQGNHSYRWPKFFAASTAMRAMRKAERELFPMRKR